MTPTVQITILKDNLVTRPGVTPGHGLSMLVEAGGLRVLFDTGPDDSLVANAAALDVSLYPLDAIVISHGHWDHTGGLAAALHVAGPTKVIAHPGVFDRTFSGPAPGELRYIGMPLTQEEFEQLGARFEFSELPVALGDGLLTTGRVPPLHLEGQQRAGLWRNKAGAPHPDDFRDDTSLVVRLAECTAILTGCAHAGLTNILCKSQTIVPDRPPRVLIGGLHLGWAGDDEVTRTAREVAELGVAILMPCHCTGEHAVHVLLEHFPGKVTPIGTGTVIRVHDHGDTEVMFPLG